MKFYQLNAHAFCDEDLCEEDKTASIIARSLFTASVSSDLTCNITLGFNNIDSKAVEKIISESNTPNEFYNRICYLSEWVIDNSEYFSVDEILTTAPQSKQLYSLVPFNEPVISFFEDGKILVKSIQGLLLISIDSSYNIKYKAFIPRTVNNYDKLAFGGCYWHELSLQPESDLKSLYESFKENKFKLRSGLGFILEFLPVFLSIEEKESISSIGRPYWSEAPILKYSELEETTYFKVFGLEDADIPEEIKSVIKRLIKPGIEMSTDKSDNPTDKSGSIFSWPTTNKKIFH